MKRFFAWIDRASDMGGFLSGFFMVLIVILILVEVGMRTLLKGSTMIADEYSAYFFVVVSLMGFSLALKDNVHIKITLLSSRFGQKGRLVLDALSFLLALFLCAFAFYYSARMCYDSYLLKMTADSISGTPLYIPQMMIPLGFLLLFFQLAAILARRFISFQTH